MGDRLPKLVSRYLGYMVPLRSAGISMLSVSVQNRIKIARQVLKKPTPQLAAVELHQSATAFDLMRGSGIPWDPWNQAV